MLRLTLAVCRKDLTLVLARGSGLVQALLLGLLLLFVFSLSQGVGERMTPQGAAAVFWLSSAFCQVLVFNQLYALEEASNARLGLLLCPAPVQAVWLGKGCAGLVLLVLAQLVFLPAAVVFLGQEGRSGLLAGGPGPGPGRTRIAAQHCAFPAADAASAGRHQRGGADPGRARPGRSRPLVGLGRRF